ncbi:hypothetical protein DNX69_17575 [Rhodopseudomonas palustris]|uniref:Uncharacterized protein n=1 Tax=Rhodopseudomonas palustris TaxID=1076 RepID=A0A323UE10_RHOPL|nr:hypothetical protein [Rhodopseudomonas palustris]PZA11125.1 hypothetical protein DNX69_17575 [Rhodopseudomonas palustris]
MTKPELELLLDRVAAWPSAAQQDLLDSIIEIEARHGLVYRLSEDDRIAVERGLADLQESRLASDQTVAALFNRFRA